MTNRAALYLRSSKDRSDVSIDAQRRALQELASTRGLVVVEEFADAVESGKDVDRPSFQRLIHSLKDPRRQWDYVLALDTSRVARGRHLAQIFEHECKRARVTLVFKSIPDADPIQTMLLTALLQAMDEWHSLTSKAKGLAGMAENVRQGWRAGGKAPRGYELEYHQTGAIREGAPVLKTKLKPAADAPLVGAYLRARAAGRPRGVLIGELKLIWSAGSLNDLEWMALTYAGHTVWSSTNEFTKDGYLGGTKRKPRAEWQIQRDTHPALITTEEAEAILDQLERGRIAQTRATEHPFLLTGLLVDPHGTLWTGDWDNKMNAGNYRLGKGRRISCRRVDTAVLDQVREDLSGDEAVGKVVVAMRAMVTEPVDERAITTAEKRIVQLTNKVAKLVDLLTDSAEAERAAFRRSIAAFEGERTGLIADLANMRERARQQEDAKAYTEDDARRLLRTLFDSLVEGDGDVQMTKTALGGLLEKIVFDPETEHCHVHYRIGASHEAPDTGIKLATLRGFEPRYSP